jgi:tetratricopeptide (TPR) repeat protein
MTWLREWTEAFGDPPPAWAQRLAAELTTTSDVLVVWLAGARETGHQTGREVDELLVEVLAELPKDGEFVRLVDSAGGELVRHAEKYATDLPVLFPEALFRLLRIVADVHRQLPTTTDEVHSRVRDDSYIVFRGGEGRDLPAEFLHAVAQSQTSEEFVPLWWRLCSLDSLAPEHAEIGVLGLRWSPVADRPDFAAVLGHGLALVAEGASTFAHDDLLSDTRARRLFLRLIRTTMRARSDLDWAAVGKHAHEQVLDEDARRWTERGFGLEGRDSAQRRRDKTRPYEDPERARSIADRLRANEGGSLIEAHSFLEAQRSEASRRGDALPLVQSLCYFASAITDRDAKQAVEWAREASLWQPHNHYTAVTLAEAYSKQGQPTIAAEVLLSRLMLLADAPAMWVETGKILDGIGETVAAGEALTEAAERFPDHSVGWSALGEHLVRMGRPSDAVTVFRAGLKTAPDNQYLLPGQIRALALAHQFDEAWALLGEAEAVMPRNHAVLRRRRKELETNDIEVREPAPFSAAWRQSLATDARAGLALLLRRAARRDGRSLASTDPSLRAELIEAILTDDRRGIPASSELAFSGYLSGAAAVTGAVRELLRVRVARASLSDPEVLSESFETFVVDDKRAGASDQRLAPLRELTRLRASATFVDGASLERERTAAISTLRVLGQSNGGGAPSMGVYEIRQFTIGQRRGTWAWLLLNTLGIANGTTPESVASLRAVVREKSPQLDAIEEDMALALGT